MRASRAFFSAEERPGRWSASLGVEPAAGRASPAGQRSAGEEGGPGVRAPASGGLSRLASGRRHGHREQAVRAEGLAVEEDRRAQAQPGVELAVVGPVGQRATSMPELASPGAWATAL